MLTEPERTRLVRVLRLLSSDRLGERAAAAAMANRIVQSAGLDWDDVLRLPRPPPYIPPPDPQEAEREREQQRAIWRGRDWAECLSDPELDVLVVVANCDEPTERQKIALAKILAKIKRAYQNAGRV